MSETLCPTPPEWRALELGAASPEFQRRFAKHVVECSQCRTRLGELPSIPNRSADAPRAFVSQTDVSVAGQAPRRVTDKKHNPYAFLLPPERPDELGRLGGYRVLRLLGQGGMGLVFLAEDITLGRKVALKVMKPSAEDGDGWKRFQREFRTLAALKHEHLVTIYQAGQEGAVTYFAMELLQGETLHARLKRDPCPDLKDILRIARELAAGLAVLHGQGIVHRDLKPANIWLETPGDRVKILDLGLARPTRARTRLTEAGAVMGTPGFMSPEQARGDTLDTRSDLFSLGCVLYCLSTGREPFNGTTTAALFMSLAADDPEPPQRLNPRLPLPFCELVLALLQKAPPDRSQSIDEVCLRLERLDSAAENKPAASTGPTAVLRPAPLKAKKRSRKLRTAERRPRFATKAALVAGIVLSIGLATWLVSLLFRAGDADAGMARGNGTQSLAALEPLASENWPFYPPPMPSGEQPGKVIRIQGILQSNALFMHPPKEPRQAASVTYDIDRKYSTFEAEVSFNDGPPRSYHPCTFHVYGDGKLLWTSSVMSSQADAQKCNVPIKGVRTLRLAVTCAGPPQGAHAVWLGPRVK